MDKTRYITILTATFGILLTVLSSWATESVVTPAMLGQWEGHARIIVSWCHQTNLPVKVDIHADGSVTGMVGDAKLSKGRFHRNRGWLGRKLNLATDYIITGKLDGTIVAAEGISRERVKMPLNFSGGSFKGGINSSGWKFGGKDKMVLSAASQNGSSKMMPPNRGVGKITIRLSRHLICGSACDGYGVGPSWLPWCGASFARRPGAPPRWRIPTSVTRTRRLGPTPPGAGGQ
jgi:hypothetical protein